MSSSNARSWLVTVFAVTAIAACGDDDGGDTPRDMGLRDTGGDTGRVDMGPDEDAGPECEGDGDCTGDQICVEGECVDPPTECETDEDCAEGETCTPAGVCAPVPADCETDADCDPDGVTGGLFLCDDGECGPVDLSECPADTIVERVCAIAAADGFCAMGLYVSCGDPPSCEACADDCDDDTGCSAPPMDGGPPDMGPPDDDMGPPPDDMGPPDAGPPPDDMGPPPDDMGPTDGGPPAVCGNGIVETGEDCDGPVAATCTEAGCDVDCNFIVVAPGCGNGCSEAGEACGEPGLPMCAGGSACVNCGCAVTCGNGTADTGEQCNEPGLTCGAGSTCNNTTCLCVPLCGNGTVDPGENCDPPMPPSCGASTYCAPTCQVMPRPVMCGNGCIDPGEECGEPGTDPCRDGSRCAGCVCVPNCGNGLIDIGETCDPPQPPPGAAQGCPATYCDSSCQVAPRPRVCGNGCFEAGEPCGDPGTPGCGVGQSCSASCACTFTPTQTFTNTTPVVISETGTPTVTSTISVTGAREYIRDVNVTLNVTHANTADLDITLTSPFGTVITLTTDNPTIDGVCSGRCPESAVGNTLQGTRFDDSASLGITDTPMVTGTTVVAAVPEEGLAAFIDQNPAGTWTLTISDDTGGNGGTLNSWSLEIRSETTPRLTTIFGTGISPSLPIPFTGDGVAGPSDATSIGLPISGRQGVVCEIGLGAAISHTWNNDLLITLTSPSGTTVTVSSRNGGSLDNIFGNTMWGDRADSDGQVPYVDNPGMCTDHPYANNVSPTPLTPEESFGVFIGEPPNGTWTLTVDDEAFLDGGMLTGVSMNIVTCLPRMYGITSTGQLATFAATDPSSVTTTAISGLPGGETIVGMDFRPVSGELYALSSASVLYRINPTSGAATAVAGPLSTLISGTSFGFDFNPTVDRIRVHSDTGQDLRLNPDTGGLVAVDGTLAYAPGDPNFGMAPNVVASAYPGRAGVMTTTLYAIDTGLDVLAIVNPPNNGTLNTVGPLGTNLGATTSFDILSDGVTNTAYVVSGSPSTFYTINLATGAATSVGAIGGGLTLVTLAAAPTVLP